MVGLQTPNATLPRLTDREIIFEEF